MNTVSDTRYERACACLIGMAIGDALGMPSQTLSRAEIARHYGSITRFMPPFPDHPVSHGLKAAQVTDDTEQAFLLANRLIEDSGEIDETFWAKDLLRWERDVRARGLRDLLGPSSKAALDAMLKGASANETGRYGTTNGAAMRIAPVGIATPVSPLSVFVDHIELACRMTHNTGEAIASAAAVAAAVSGGLEGLSFDAALEGGLRAAREGQNRGYREGFDDLAHRISDAVLLADTGVSPEEFAEKTGTSVASYESIPAAFGIVRLAGGDPWKAVLIAANIGNDTDTIGAISGAMAGACAGIYAFPRDKVICVRNANDLPIEQTVRDLLALRAAPTLQFRNRVEALR